jgi:hypothetical protein
MAGLVGFLDHQHRAPPVRLDFTQHGDLAAALVSVKFTYFELHDFFPFLEGFFLILLGNGLTGIGPSSSPLFLGADDDTDVLRPGAVS